MPHGQFNRHIGCGLMTGAVEPKRGDAGRAFEQCRIGLLRDFAEDRRASMEIYADHLADALVRQAPAGWQVDQYRPRIPRAISALPVNELNALRLARYLIYPFQARGLKADINHVIDHGYGHLCRVLPRTRTVVTVHDLIPLLRWKGEIAGVAPARQPWLSRFSFASLRRAARLIAISENTKRDLIRHIGCDPARISVARWGIDRRFRPYDAGERQRVRMKLGLPGPEVHLVLMTAAAFYKNFETSLQVGKRLQTSCARPVLLVRFGYSVPEPEWDSAVRAAGMENRVVTLPHVSNEAMCDLYNAVDCVLFPSWYEGLGLPPVEAMACGTPAVTSNAGALAEAVGDAAPMTAPGDVGGLATLVRAMLEDAAWRREWIEKGFRQAAKFSWERHADHVLRVYRDVLEEAGP